MGNKKLIVGITAAMLVAAVGVGLAAWQPWNLQESPENHGQITQRGSLCSQRGRIEVSVREQELISEKQKAVAPLHQFFL